jgi:PAS domain-containing protein
MAQSQVEIILLKQLASCLAMPMLVVGAEGELVFFNEAVESLLGLRFDDLGEMGLDEWPATLGMTDEDGRQVSDADRPVVAALETRRPAHRRVGVHGAGGVRRELAGTGIPLVGHDGQLLGALGLFWEPQSSWGAPRDDLGGPHEVELILMRRLAGYLAIPIFMVDASGRLLYFNEAAEPLWGRGLEEVLSIAPAELYATLEPTDEEGSPLKLDAHPIEAARARREPAHSCFSMRGLDGVSRNIEETAIPLIGQSRRLLGAVGFFWEIDES